MRLHSLTTRFPLGDCFVDCPDGIGNLLEFAPEARQMVGTSDRCESIRQKVVNNVIGQCQLEVFK